MKFGFILDNKFDSEIHYKRKIKDLTGNGAIKFRSYLQ